MSTASIAIPARPPATSLRLTDTPSPSSFSSSSSPSSARLTSLNGSPSSPGELSKAPVSNTSFKEKKDSRKYSRRESLLGSSLSGAEYTVVDVARHAEGPPRLVSCVKSGQGFEWNQELFLPSYVHRQAEDWEIRADPVQEILVTDEEAAEFLPQ